MLLVTISLGAALLGLATAYAVEPVTKVDKIEISEDGKLTTPQLIEKYGYTSETHHIETADGYILELHRVVGRHNETRAGHTKKVVFLMHGLLCTSADWVYLGPDKSLSYLLSDEGYDVWMGNARGNRYSKNHTTFNVKDKQFWQFSWHEIGIYDLPASIDYVLETTGQKRLQYIGHSQGTTVFYVMTSMLPVYNDKVILMQSLAPVAYLAHTKAPLLVLAAKFVKDLEVSEEEILIEIDFV
jgi:lysosomal acid lipase/cholesteryl ester hydrolase